MTHQHRDEEEGSFVIVRYFLVNFLPNSSLPHPRQGSLILQSALSLGYESQEEHAWTENRSITAYAHEDARYRARVHDAATF